MPTERVQRSHRHWAAPAGWLSDGKQARRLADSSLAHLDAPSQFDEFEGPFLGSIRLAASQRAWRAAEMKFAKGKKATQAGL